MKDNLIKDRVYIDEDIILIKCNNIDKYKEFIYQTKKLVYKKYVENYWGKWNDNIQRDLFSKFINTVVNDIWIIKYKNNDIGFYNGNNIDEDSYEIGNICIIPEYQGKIIGSKILNKIMKLHNNHKCFKNNQVGNLYKRLGFELCKEKEFHHLLVKINPK